MSQDSQSAQQTRASDQGDAHHAACCGCCSPFSNIRARLRKKLNVKRPQSASKTYKPSLSPVGSLSSDHGFGQKAPAATHGTATQTPAPATADAGVATSVSLVQPRTDTLDAATQVTAGLAEKGKDVCIGTTASLPHGGVDACVATTASLAGTPSKLVNAAVETTASLLEPSPPPPPQLRALDITEAELHAL